MRRHNLIYEFILEKKDDWGNRWYKCPLCGYARKEDGLIKHMVAQAKDDKRYAKWLKEHQK